MRAVLKALVKAYRLLISPLLPPSCRFYPTCSEYALEALDRHGALRGSWLTLKRLGRCHPLCKGGVDPVPGSEKATDTVCQCSTESVSRETGPASGPGSHVVQSRD